jgi:hypothetical protein
MRRLIPYLAAGCFLAVLAAVLLQAQRRDFLSDDEGDQIREAQEPNERLAAYLKFARLRLELARQILAAPEKPGRSKLVHDNLEDYTKILEAMDAVVDDALARKMDVTKGVALLAQQDKVFLATLQGLAKVPAKDKYLFEFVLQDATEATQDSMEESEHDLKERTQRVLEEDRSEKKKRQEAMTPAEAESRKKAEAKTAGTTDSKGKTKKVPSLRRKGEEPKQEQ